MSLSGDIIHPVNVVKRALGYADYASLPEGISFAGNCHATADIRFLTDLTWIDSHGMRVLDQQIFDEVLAMVASARRLIIIDMFLFNDLLRKAGETPRPLSAELTTALVRQKQRYPDIAIFFITDPCNTVYGGLPSPYFKRLEDAGVIVVMTDLDKLRDSNPIYSFIWRLFIRPFGNSPGGLFANPFGGGGRISLRSFLQIGTMKANHRKSLLADVDGQWTGLITTANPHDASYANRNVAIRFTGPAVADLYLSEKAVLAISGIEPPAITIDPPGQQSATRLQILTEGKIKRAVLETIDKARNGDRLDMVLFYLADRDILNALNSAARRSVQIRLVLDPNKDAFGWSKSGIPNRPVAHRLVKRGMQVRWADVHGEQCHSKMMSAMFKDGDTVLILGSANFTRRNIEDFNLEADVRISGPSDAPALAAAHDMFDAIWSNRDGRRHTVDYEHYRERSLFQHWLYWFMETTGISTF